MSGSARPWSAEGVVSLTYEPVRMASFVRFPLVLRSSTFTGQLVLSRMAAYSEILIGLELRQ